MANKATAIETPSQGRARVSRDTLIIREGIPSRRGQVDYLSQLWWQEPAQGA